MATKRMGATPHALAPHARQDEGVVLERVREALDHGPGEVAVIVVALSRLTYPVSASTHIVQRVTNIDRLQGSIVGEPGGTGRPGGWNSHRPRASMIHSP